MASQEQPPPLPPPSPSLLPPREFPLQRLPLELRDQIWTLTLPSRRVFTVRRISRKNYETDIKFFEFCYPLHPPPLALSVCRESRAVALRQGFFFSAGHNPGVWFRPDTDMLFFTVMQKATLTTKTHINIPGWDRVLHLGIRSQAFYDNVSDPPPDDLAEIMELFYSHMPNLKTVKCIAPGDPPGLGKGVFLPLPGGDADTYALMRGLKSWEASQLIRETGV